MKNKLNRINLCCGNNILSNWINIDCAGNADILIDLENQLMPFEDNSIEAVACISAINYFSLNRGYEIISDVYRILKPGGIARFAVQDLKLFTEYYQNRAHNFWTQRLNNGATRFPGRTFGEKFNMFFSGFQSGGHNCKYFYDYETLEMQFRNAGFSLVEKKDYMDSRLPEVALLDNRPEQMFFLEAVKQPELAAFDPEFALKNSSELFAINDKQRAWQELLRIAAHTPWHTKGMSQLISGCIEAEQPRKAMQAIDHYRSFGGKEFDKLQQLLIGRARAHERPVNTPEELRWLDRRENRILSDHEHAQACINWLIHAQSVTEDGGVSSAYYPLRETWDSSYPETTGYIIATFLAWSRYAGTKETETLAVQLGDWEREIQWPEGGIGEPYGAFAPHPRSFNTGQVLLGWMALYEHTGKARFLEAAVRAGRWLTGNVDGDGRFIRNVYQGPRAYKCRVAWALFELSRLSGETIYADCARRITSWTLGNALSTGWFAENSLTTPLHPWTHLISYTLVGLVQIVHLAPPECELDYIYKILEQAAYGLCRAEEQRGELRFSGKPLPAQPGTYDPEWKSDDKWSCLTGNAQSAFFLLRLAPLMKDSRRIEAAARHMLEDLKRVHLMDEVDNPDLYGGLAGSWPIGAPYCTWMLPNWAPKFFVDALLLRMMPNATFPFIG